MDDASLAASAPCSCNHPKPLLAIRRTDLPDTIRQLEAQKRKVELAILELARSRDGVRGGGVVIANRRGRKSMVLKSADGCRNG